MFKKLSLLALLTLCTNLLYAETMVTIQTSQGNIQLSLDEKKAPKTVANFISYANSGFYNGTIFHRVMDGFMIQGGGFDQNMKDKPTKAPIVNEANNGLKNTIGTIAMARTEAPHSASSQFFINVANNDFLNHTAKTNQGYGYTVFGKVTKGMDVVNKIAKVPTTDLGMHEKVPIKPIMIKKVIIQTHKGL